MASPTNLPTETESIETSTPAAAYKPRYIDIGINLTDPIFTGVYHGKQQHPSDFPSIITRALSIGCTKMIVTGSDVDESLKAVELAKTYTGTLYATIGVHPCNSSQFTKNLPTSAQLMLDRLRAIAISSKASGHAIAFGEIGLDYDRLFLSPKETQVEFFAKQLDIAVEIDLPLFLHSRAAHEDFIKMLREKTSKGGLVKRGVVHSFTGTKEEMMELVGDGWDIGVNGCSLKTVENCEVVKAIPLERLQLETDGPWCEMRPSHAGSAYLKDYTGPEEKEGGGTNEEGKGWRSVKKEKWVEGVVVKGRNEPCFIGKVAWAVAGIRGESLEVVCEAAWGNTVRMFGLSEV